MSAKLRAFGLLVARFVGVYGPAFLVVDAFRMPLDRAVPAVIVLTLTACLLMQVAARGEAPPFAHFGFAGPRCDTPFTVSYGLYVALRT